MSATSKRLAKNTLFMYGRMFILMIISFYTSRVVLQQLGVTDYGIYSVVGSVVAMFSSLRTIFATSTQRFLNYEMGRHSDKLNLVFDLSMVVNIFIGLIFVLLVEVVGLWFLNSHFNAPETRICSAYWVLHLSVLSAFLSIITTPYDAVIIAHERMDFYAYMSIFESLLKLLLAFLLIWSVFDKLVFYAVLQLLVAAVVRIVNAWYCHLHFPESKFSYRWDQHYLKEMFSFAGWNYLGNTAYSLTQNALNMLLNTFGGPVVNAARGIAYQVQGSLNQVISNINIVVSPYCIKSHAEGNDTAMFKMMFMSSKILFVVQLLISIAFVFFSQWILSIWLTEVPDYSAVFLQFVMIISLVRSIHGPIDTVFKAFGKIKMYQISEGLTLSFPILASFVLLKYGASVYCVFYTMIFCELLNAAIIIPIAHNYSNLSIKKYFCEVVVPCIVSFLIALVFFIIYKYIYPSFVNALWTSLFAVIISITYMWFMGFNNDERLQIVNLIKRKNG